MSTTPYVVLAESLGALRNGSFLKLHVNGNVARYVNGDLVSEVAYDESRGQRITGQQIFSKRVAKRNIPTNVWYGRAV